MTRNEVAHGAIDDRPAGRKVIELDLMTEERHSALPEDEEVCLARTLFRNQRWLRTRTLEGATLSNDRSGRNES